MQELRAVDHADADQRVQSSEQGRIRKQHVAHVNREQRAEAAHREHAGGHGQNHERDGTLCVKMKLNPWRIEDSTELAAVAGRRYAVNGQRHHHRGGEEEAEAIEKEAGVGPEPLHQQARDGRTDDLRSLHGLRHQPVDGQQSGGGRQRAHRHRLRGHEEAGHRAQRQEDDVDGVDVAHEDQHQNQNAAHQSLAIMVHFTFHLSTKTPASGLTTASGSMYATRIMLTWVGVPCS